MAEDALGEDEGPPRAEEEEAELDDPEAAEAATFAEEFAHFFST